MASHVHLFSLRPLSGNLCYLAPRQKYRFEWQERRKVAASFSQNILCFRKAVTILLLPLLQPVAVLNSLETGAKMDRPAHQMLSQSLLQGAQNGTCSSE